MKRIAPLVSLICASLAFSSCQFSAGAKKDLATGLTYKYHGFGVTDVVLVSPDDKRMTDNKVDLNTEVGVVAFGLSGYTLKDGKAFPGLMLYVTDEKGAFVLREDDLVAAGTGYPPQTAATMRGSITVGRPMVSGQTYHVKMRVWDKLKTENELNVELDILVK